MKLQPAIYQLLLVIVDRGKAELVVDYLKSLQVNLQVLSFGEGAAPSNWHDVLNYCQEKEIIFALINTTDSKHIWGSLDQTFLLHEKNTGIAFTIPLKSITYDTMDLIKRSKNNEPKI